MHLNPLSSRYFNMTSRNKSFYILAFSLLLVAIAIHFYADNAMLAENQYATSFYISFSKILRSLFGWIPFSIGDILYGSLFIYILFKTIKIFKKIFHKEKRKLLFKNFQFTVVKFFLTLLVIYIVFNLFWGINYNRLGIAYQLNLDTTAYTSTELKNINRLLITAVNEDKVASVLQTPKAYDYKYIKRIVKKCYDSAALLYPIPIYSPSSLKPSMWGWLGNYSGFTGYYNPFTGEAQVNTTVPFFEQPFIACHEVAHQLGYAKEMEANFVGFLAATSTNDPFFKYSVHMDLFLYANRNLFSLDSVTANANYEKLLPAVKKDIAERIAFSRRHRSFLQPIFLFFYEKFLWSNQQPQGLMSYDEVTGFIISFYRKYSKI